MLLLFYLPLLKVLEVLVITHYICMEDSARLGQRLAFLEKKLAEIKPKYLERKRNFRGVRHEDSLSELRYTEFMVYKNIYEGLEQEIFELKKKIRELKV